MVSNQGDHEKLSVCKRLLRQLSSMVANALVHGGVSSGLPVTALCWLNRLGGTAAVPDDDDYGEKVSVRRHFVVTPETSSPRRTMFLNNMDQRLGFYSRALFFYEPGPGLMSIILAILRKSLERVLVMYDFFCGRLAFDPQGRLEIDCNNAGVVVAVAQSRLSVSNITEADLEDLFYQPPSLTLEELPLFTIQVTELSGGGYAFGGLFHHVLGDAASMMAFLKNLCPTTRGSGPPNSDRQLFAARVPPQPCFEHPEFACQVDHVASRFTVTREAVCQSESLRKNTPRRQRTTRVFSAERLELLKKEALDDGVLSKCSNFDALAAHVWQSRVKSLARNAADVVKLRFLINVRNVLQPPLGVSFCGNAAYGTVAEAAVHDISHEPLSRVVKRIQAAKSRVTDEYVRSGWDFLELHPDYWYEHDCDTVINCWPSITRESLQLDFGMGKPKRIEFPLDPRNPSIVFFPYSDGGYAVSYYTSEEFERILQ